MKKLFIVVLAYAYTTTAFSHECGELKLKGTLKENAETKALEFHVLDGTTSKRTYTFTDTKSLPKLKLFIDKQLNLTAMINQAPDGTKGVIDSVTLIDLIFQGHLQMNKNAITVVNAKKCEVK